MMRRSRMAVILCDRKRQTDWYAHSYAELPQLVTHYFRQVCHFHVIAVTYDYNWLAR